LIKRRPKRFKADLGRVVRNFGKNNFLEEKHNIVVEVAVGGSARGKKNIKN
jgi:hypothetical protein